jgi:hypothetical protein
VTVLRPPRAREGDRTPLYGDNRERNVVSLLAEVVMLPMTALLYGLELLVRAVQGVQQATQQGIESMVTAPVASPAPLATAGGEVRDPGSIDTNRRGNAGDPAPRPAVKEAAPMEPSICHETRRDRDLRDDMLKLVRYKILFVRREYEVAFPEQEDLVEDNMDPTAFAAWKVAEFVQQLARGKTQVPAKWLGKRYPDEKDAQGHDQRRGDILLSLPEEDKKYLRVYYEVLDRYPREKFKHEEQQIRVLEQIRDGIHSKQEAKP